MHIYDGTPSPLPLTSTTELDATVGIASLLEASTKLAHSLGIKTRVQENLLYATKYVGEENAPQDIKRLRRQVHDMMRRMGQPVMIKKMLTVDDVKKGYAEKSPNFDSIYGQTRNNDHFSWGAGFVSKEKSKDEWIDPSTGNIIRSKSIPDPSWPKAPKYRGYGPGIITYLIEPDAPQDFFYVDSKWRND